MRACETLARLGKTFPALCLCLYECAFAYRAVGSFTMLVETEARNGRPLASISMRFHVGHLRFVVGCHGVRNIAQGGISGSYGVSSGDALVPQQLLVFTLELRGAPL